MIMEYSIKITGDDLADLKKILYRYSPDENAAFLLVGKNHYGNNEELIVRRIIEIPDEEFKFRSSYHLEISTRAIHGMISLCEANKLGVILCHSHPRLSLTNYSSSDDFGERRIVSTFNACLPSYPIASLLVLDNTYRARYWTPTLKHIPINSIKVVGRYLETINLGDKKNTGHKDIKLYDRQVLAFGELGQHKIGETKVGIVGVGSTGSAVAEQLVRLGVNDLVLIDKDYFEPSNLTRIYGSFYNNIPSRWAKKFDCRKTTKVDIIKKHLCHINKNIKIQSIAGNIVYTDVCKKVLDRDIIFSCTDDHWGRAILNQIAYQYIIPTINMGVRIDSSNGQITAGTGALHSLMPGKPCLWCYEYLKPEIIYSESLPTAERDKLLKEKYVQGIQKASSVISLTSMIASMAVTLFLQMVTDFMGKDGDITYLRHDIMLGTISKCNAPLKDGCICQKVKGKGDFTPLHTLPNM